MIKTLQQYEVQHYYTPLQAPIQHAKLSLDADGMFSPAQDALIASSACGMQGLAQREMHVIDMNLNFHPRFYMKI